MPGMDIDLKTGETRCDNCGQLERDLQWAQAQLTDITEAVRYRTDDTAETIRKILVVGKRLREASERIIGRGRANPPPTERTPADERTE